MSVNLDEKGISHVGGGPTSLNTAYIKLVRLDGEDFCCSHEAKWINRCPLFILMNIDPHVAAVGSSFGWWYNGVVRDVHKFACRIKRNYIIIFHHHHAIHRQLWGRDVQIPARYGENWTSAVKILQMTSPRGSWVKL